jgi:hypothetical protein
VDTRRPAKLDLRPGRNHSLRLKGATTASSARSRRARGQDELDVDTLPRHHLDGHVSPLYHPRARTPKPKSLASGISPPNRISRASPAASTGAREVVVLMPGHRRISTRLFQKYRKQPRLTHLLLCIDLDRARGKIRPPSEYERRHPVTFRTAKRLISEYHEHLGDLAPKAARAPARTMPLVQFRGFLPYFPQVAGVIFAGFREVGRRVGREPAFAGAFSRSGGCS